MSKETEQKKDSIDQLKEQLTNLFQIENKDLDFGIYKIYGVLNKKLKNWINNDDRTDIGNKIKKEIEKELEDKNIDSNVENIQHTVCDNIVKFYKNIYKDGDYVIPRTNIISNDINTEDVTFDWKTKGQILIKNMDVQTYFSFNTEDNKKIEFKVVDIIDYGDNGKNKGRQLIPISIELKKDNKDNTIGLTVEFVLGNFDDKTFKTEYKSKENNDIDEEDENLEIRENKETIGEKIESLINSIDNRNLEFTKEKKKGNYLYEKDKKEYNLGEKEIGLTGKEDKLGVIHLIKLFLDKKEEKELKNKLFGTEDNGILIEKGRKEVLNLYKLEDGSNCLLSKNLRKWYRQGTSDFFLNPNLGQELDNYKKTFIKDEMYNYLIKKTKGINNAGIILSVFEKIINEINTFLTTIEDIQVTLFNRKKYIYETHYVITIDRLKIFSLDKDGDFNDLREFLKDFLGDNGYTNLQDEYIELGLIKNSDKKDNINDFIDFLLKNDKLYLDTKKVVKNENKGKGLLDIYSKTYDLLDYIGKFINFVNKNKGEDKNIDNKLKELKIELEQGEELNLDKLLNGEIYKGDNYHVLNLLQNKYAEEIKTIYIDPPYNTGDDGFLYKDNMKHSSWLTMMESRLKLARELMKDDGVIFSSIDDNEVDNLKKLESSIFGENNFISNLIWKKTGQQQNNGKNIATTTENLLLFGKKDKDNDIINKEKIENRKGISAYSHEDKDGRKFRVNPIRDYTYGKEEWETIHPITKNKITGKHWRISFEKFLKLEEEGMIYWGVKSNVPQIKKYLDTNKGVLVNNLIDGFYNEEATGDLKKININFKNSKPVNLIKYLLNISSKEDSIILDFFPGSGTTADAVIRLNQEDGGNRKFILTEINDYFDTIIIPRIKKVAYNLEWKNGNPQDNKGPGIFFKYSYLENYEDTLENFSLNLKDEIENNKDLDTDLYNLSLIIGIAFSNSNKEVTDKDIFVSVNQNTDSNSYPSYKLTNKRDDIVTFDVNTKKGSVTKSYVDLVHYYPLSKDGKWILKTVKKVEEEKGKYIFTYINSEDENKVEELILSKIKL